MKEIKLALSHLAAIIWTASWFLAFILPTADGRTIFGLVVTFSTIALVVLGVKYLIDHWDEDGE